MSMESCGSHSKLSKLQLFDSAAKCGQTCVKFNFWLWIPARESRECWPMSFLPVWRTHEHNYCGKRHFFAVWCDFGMHFTLFWRIFGELHSFCWSCVCRFSIRKSPVILLWICLSVYYPCFMLGLVLRCRELLPFVTLPVSLHFLTETLKLWSASFTIGNLCEATYIPLRCKQKSFA